MTSKQLENAYKIFDNIFCGKFLFALGGYYSLIRQGILEETRLINDLDINIIMKGGEDIYSLKSNILQAISDIKRRFDIQSSEYAMCYKIPERKSYGEDGEELLEENFTHGGEQKPMIIDDINSNFAVEISILPLRTKPYDRSKLEALRSAMAMGPTGMETSPRSRLAQTYEEWIADRLNLSGPYRGGIDSGLVFHLDGSSVTTANTNSATCTTIPYAQPVDIPQHFRCTRNHLDDQGKTDILEMLQELIFVNPNTTLKIDFFFLDSENIHKKVLFKDGELLTHYYPILKAKHRYCMDIKTIEAQFEKHLRDLVLSYRKVRIMGVNCEEDIRSLIQLRREQCQE